MHVLPSIDANLASYLLQRNTTQLIWEIFVLDLGKTQSNFNWEWGLLQDPHTRDVMP